ncbi:hypothetical protein IC582_014023 [Cucumis melo]
MLLVKGKAVDSQQCYGGGEGTSFNASKVGNLVDDVFVDFSAPIIDNQTINEEMGTSISEDPEDGIYHMDRCIFKGWGCLTMPYPTPARVERRGCCT